MTTSQELASGAEGRWIGGRWLEGPALDQALTERPPRSWRSSTPGDGSRSWRSFVNRWELAYYAGIFFIALAMRLWDLGSRAVHHDESLHGYFAYVLFDGGGYIHNPLMHGTFLFHTIAGSFWLFGDNEVTMRLPMALFGSVLVLMPLLFRSRLGTVGAMAAAGLLAFSPALLYYSRFARNDIFMAVFTLGLVISMWRYMDEGRNRWLYTGAAFLALGYTTKETQFIVTAILAMFLLTIARRDIWNWLMGRQSLREFGRAGGFLVMLLGLSLPLFAPGIAVIQDTLGITLAAPDGTPGTPTGSPVGGVAYGVAIAFTVLFLIVGFAVGLFWNARAWLISWVIFAAIFATLFTTVFTHGGGVATGTWQSLGYWIAQHDVARGNQPWYYYFIITSVYEFLPWLFALGAAAFYTWRGDRFTRFLVYWSVATFIAYTLAGEKMPWLLVNITLPLLILTARAINDIARSVDWRTFIHSKGLLVLPAAPLFVLLTWRLIFFRGFGLTDFLLLWVLLAAMGFLLLGLQYLANRIGWKPALGTVSLALAITLLAPFTIRAGWIASYYNGDIPREMLVYTQTSPELHAAAKQIDAVAQMTEEKYDIHIQIDGADGFAWPWRWYLRHYNRVFWPEYDRVSQPVERSPVISVINARNNGRVQPELPVSYGDGRRIVHRWWFPENYRYGNGEDGNMVPPDFFGTIIDRDRWRGAIDYFLYRELSNPLGTVDSYVYFSESLPVQAAR